jgi:hypothetical protein
VDGDVVSVERVIPAAPGAIFDLIADASRHPDIDGSGTVKEVKAGGPNRLSAGATFGMSMHLGVRYSMVNTVVEFEDNRRLAWKAAPGGWVGKFAGGRIWRYELEPVAGGTRVQESWDISEDHQRLFLRMGGLAKKTRSNMESTLARIEQLTAPGSS